MFGEKKLCGRGKKWRKKEMRRVNKITAASKKVNS